jgi:hypothetical protein
MEQIKAIIEKKKYNKKFFQEMGKKSWGNMAPEQRAERIEKAREWGRQGAKKREDNRLLTR